MTRQTQGTLATTTTTTDPTWQCWRTVVIDGQEREIERWLVQHRTNGTHYIVQLGPDYHGICAACGPLAPGEVHAAALWDYSLDAALGAQLHQNEAALVQLDIEEFEAWAAAKFAHIAALMEHAHDRRNSVRARRAPKQPARTPRKARTGAV